MTVLIAFAVGVFVGLTIAALIWINHMDKEYRNGV